MPVIVAVLAAAAVGVGPAGATVVVGAAPPSLGPIVIHNTRATTTATASSSRTSTIDGPVRDCRPLAGLPRSPGPAFGVWSRGRRSTGLGGVASPGIGGAPGRV